MKKLRSIIILVVVLGILIGAYAYLSSRPKDESNIPQTVVISELNKDDIVKIELKKKNETLLFEKKGDEWTVDYPYPVVLSQDEVDDIAKSFAYLDVQRLLDENPEDLSLYGLDDPVSVATATLKDGKTVTFYLGNKAPAGNAYYLMPEGEKKVYAVWLDHANNFNSSLSDVRERSFPEINGNEMRYFKIVRKGKPTIEITYNESEEEPGTPAVGISLWQMVQPYSQPMSVDGADFNTDVLQVLPNFMISHFIDDNPESLAKYGLEDPWGEFEIRDNQNSIHLYFGDEYEDDYVYFRMEGSNQVYTIGKHLLDFMDVNAFDWVVKFAFVARIDDVDKVIVEKDGVSHTLSMTRKTEKAENEGEEDQVITTYLLNGKDIGESTFKSLFQKVIGLIVDTEHQKELEEKPVIKTTFYLNKGKDREVHVNYVPYDDNFYAVFRDGKSDFVISKASVDKMFNAIDEVAKGN